MNSVKKSRDKKFIIILLLSSFLLYLAWSIIIPFNHAPDEFLRFDIVNFIYKYKSLPITGDNRLVYDVHGITYASTPYLPYMISAVIGIIVKDIMKINVELFRIARIVSVLSGVGAVYFSWLIGNKVFKNSVAKYLFPVMLAFMPQFAFVCSYTNQDSFTIFLSSMMIYLWIQGIESKWSMKIVIKVGIVSGMILLAYLNGYSILIATLFLFLFTYKNKISKEFVKKVVVALGIAFIISGWFFVRNAYYYHGDIIGRKETTLVSEQRGLPQYKPSTMNTLHKQGLGFTHLIFDYSWLATTFKSFWAEFDYMSISVSYKYYFLMLIITIISFMGISYKFISIKKEGNLALVEKSFYMALVVLILTSFLLHCYYSIYEDFQAQGRYVFPGLIAIILMMCKGIEEVISEKFKKLVYILGGLFFVTFNLYVLFGILFVHYYVK